MRHSTRLAGTSQALHRVFVASTQPAQSTQRSSSLISAHSRAQHARTTPLLVRQVRSYAAFRDPRRSLPRNDEIAAQSIRVVDEAGKLRPPTTLQAVLADLDRSKYRLIQVTQATPDLEAICKIIEIPARRRVDKTQPKAQSKTHILKKLELSWAIDGGDLEHRLIKLRDFLGKGMRVEVVLAHKKQGRRASWEEAMALVARINETIKALDGASEAKAMEGKILGTATFFFQGVPQSKMR